MNHFEGPCACGRGGSSEPCGDDVPDEPPPGLSDCGRVLCGMFREGGALAALRWPWEDFVPVVERHLFRVMDEVDAIDERHERLFDRCAPELLDAPRLERMTQALRHELMSPERTADEKRALAVAVLELVSAPRHPPYARRSLPMVSGLMMAQVDEWVARRQRVQAVVDTALAPGRPIDPETIHAALARAAVLDPELMALLGEYERAILQAILEGRTPPVLHGEEWLWVTVVLREPMDPDRLAVRPLMQGEAVALLRGLDARVQRAVLARVEESGRDRASPPEAEQWFSWAYRVLMARPLAFFGAFARAREGVLFERFAGESDWVHALRRLERWCPEDLEPYRLRLEAAGALDAARCVARLQDCLPT